MNENNTDVTTTTNSRCIYFDNTGAMRIKNISAYWLPRLTVVEKIGNTTYTVSGSYEGEENFARKLERIAAQKISEEGGRIDDNEREMC